MECRSDMLSDRESETRWVGEYRRAGVSRDFLLYCGMDRRGKRCQKNRQKSSLLIPIRTGKGEIPLSCPYSQLLDRYTKGQGRWRRTAHSCRTHSCAIALASGPKVPPIILLTGGLIVIHRPEIEPSVAKLAGISAKIEWMPARSQHTTRCRVCATPVACRSLWPMPMPYWSGDGTSLNGLGRPSNVVRYKNRPIGPDSW